MCALAGAGERGVALENFCTQLLEYDVAVSSTVLKELKALAEEMGIDEKYWTRLEVHSGRLA
jgi:rRNA-processing protein FCF1